MSLSIGVDVGGTFTDVVIFDHARNDASVAKVPSVPGDQAKGFMQALAKVDAPLERVDRVMHGTTIATNAVLEHKGARVALLTTAGFRDVIEIGRGERARLYDLKLVKQPPLVERPLRFEVAERTHADGGIGKAVTEEAVRAAIDGHDLSSVEAWAICFLHSYANPANEQRAKAALQPLVGDRPIAISSAIVAEYREYERFSTTVLNAAVSPRMHRYLGELEVLLAEGGYGKPLLVMHSSGGVMSARGAREVPAATILSGPAGGVAGARAIASGAGVDNIITCDMGGTSTDVALIKEGRIRHTTEGRIAGYPTRIPQIDIVTVGAGGGSIASLSGGVLRVGPQSAGARPGPACYGLGGDAATVTDAHVLLNRLNCEAPLSGEIPLHPALARAALEALAAELELDVTNTAEGIVHLAVVKMASSIREVSVYRGHDPRDFVLMAYGGAGPMLASELASELGMRAVLVPPHPGNLSALGLLASPLKRDFVRTRIMRMDDAGASGLEAEFEALEARAAGAFAGDDVAADALIYARSLDVRYEGQSSTLNLALTARLPAPGDIVDEFHCAHAATFGHAADGEPVELVNLRVSASLAARAPEIRVRVPDGAAPRPVERRRVVFRGESLDCAVYARDALPSGVSLDGPFIVEESGSTTVGWPGDRLRVDARGNLRMEVGEK